VTIWSNKQKNSSMDHISKSPIWVFDKCGKCPQNLSNNLKDLSINIGSIGVDGVECFLQSTVVQEAANVAYLSLSGSKLPPIDLLKLTDLVLYDRIFKNLVCLDLSNINLPEVVLRSLCEYLNPFSGGYNISILNVSRCSLGQQGTNELLSSIFANVQLTDLIMAGNDCSDACVGTLVTALTKYDNNIKVIGLSGNKITATGLFFN
jgi:hypothetical protein